MITSVINPPRCYLKLACINYLDRRFRVLMARLNTQCVGSTLEEHMIWLIPATGIEANYAGQNMAAHLKEIKKKKEKKKSKWVQPRNEIFALAPV